MTVSIFTLAPTDHSTNPIELERSMYRCWSTYKRDRNSIMVRTNKDETAGGQMWCLIAWRGRVLPTDGIRSGSTRYSPWDIKPGRGFLEQGGALLSRYLIDKGEKVHSEVVAYSGKVKRYRATAKVYSLPSLLNGGRAVVSRDKEADERREKSRGVDIAAAMAARKAAK